MNVTDTLRQAGEALYGDRWQSPLSRDLGVTDRTMRNWTSGRHEAPADIFDRLLGLLKSRGESVSKLTSTIEQHLTLAETPGHGERKA